jgi:hypothetical protein
VIEFFFWEECPSHERALAILREQIARHDIEQSELTIIEVVDDEQAERLDFPGSPTIRIDGVDIQDPGDLPRGLTCRLYRKRDGRPSPLPDVDDLRDALAQYSGRP